MPFFSSADEGVFCPVRIRERPGADQAETTLPGYRWKANGHVSQKEFKDEEKAPEGTVDRAELFSSG